MQSSSSPVPKITSIPLKSHEEHANQLNKKISNKSENAINHRVSYQEVNDTIYKLKTKFSIKSPSVPDLQDTLYKKNNFSTPVLVDNNRCESNGSIYEKSTDCISGATADDDYNRDNNSNKNKNQEGSAMSVIDLYDYDDENVKSIEQNNTSHDEDHLESDEEEDDEEEDDEENLQDDDGLLTNISNSDVLPQNLNSRSNNVNSNHCDRYGFKKQNNFISEEKYDSWWENYSQYCIRRKQKWLILLAKSGLPIHNDIPVRFPPQSEKLKRYVRKGIPAEWRGNAWWYFARGQEKLNKNKNVYSTLIEKMGNLEDPKQRAKIHDLDVIERDLNRTFPDNIHFQKEQFSDQEPIMIKSLRRVLVAFSLYNPKIGYCQSMNFLAGLLLLFMDEERAFWMLVIITSKYLPGVHNVNLEGVNVDQGVLLLCIREYLPELWTAIEESYNNSYLKSTANTSRTKNLFLYKLPPITLCTASWFMSCFIGVLPIETTLRIWDCMFYEDSHFLFKASLAVFKLCEPELLKGKTSHKSFTQYSLTNNKQHRNGNNKRSQDDYDMEMFQVIQAFPKTLIDPNDIFEKVIFKRRLQINKLDQDEIDKCRKYVAVQRQKHKNYNEIMNKNSKSNSENEPFEPFEAPNKNIVTSSIDILGKDLKMTNDMVNDALSSEVYDFKRSFSGVHWNNSIKERVRQMRKKKGSDD